MKKNKWVIVGMMALALSFILGFIGCTTTIPISYTEPARLDMPGIKRIAIKSDDSNVTSFISQQLTGSGKYTVVDIQEWEQALRQWEQWKAERQAKEDLINTQTSALEVSAAELVGAYQANELRADNSYSGKVLKTSGVVKQIGKSSSGQYFARLDTGTDSIDLYFAPTELDQLEEVDKGQTITIFGICHGFNRPAGDTDEIIRILGAGRAVNLTDVRFPLEPLDDDSGPLSSPVDAVLSVDTDVSAQNDSHIEKRNRTDSSGKILKDAKGNAIQVDVQVYDRIVTVNVNYQIVRTRDMQDISPIGGGTKSATTSESNADPSLLTDPSTIAARVINSPLKELVSEMIPTEKSLSLTLAKEKTDKQAKKAMSGADKLVKAKDYKAAAEAYGTVYAQYKNFAAGYNQALLTEATEGVEAAVALMEALVKATGNATAQSALEGMQTRLAANQKSAAQLSE